MRIIALSTIIILFGFSQNAIAQDFKSAMLKIHNNERAALNIAPLQWDENLSKEAGAWAAHMAKTGEFKHANERQNNGHGENLWMGTKDYYSFEYMVQMWADEKKYFKYGKFPNIVSEGHWSKVGHYTQMIWKNTNNVGCAYASNAQYTYLVCRYSPAGNYVGQVPY